ncbi:AAA family ATPase [Salinibacillus aidingensis]|uniref:AAA family ATPase n=2 Tax=Salinibacillus aidingensis TaxID=237684 RepID=A0ABN1B5G6_9BACI
MWIEKIHIYGFGKWQDQVFEFNEQLTSVQGPNESGKTSLKQFILYVLFDLPSSRRKRYIPKQGSTYGGRLFLNTEKHGYVIVERMMDKRKNQAICILEDGRQEKEDFLTATILNGMNRHTFEQIFSFNDQDLQRLHLIKEEDLGNVLFGIGLSGSDKMTRLEKDLSRQMEQLFKKRGKKPVINEQLRQLKDVKANIRELENDEDKYNHLQEEIKQHEEAKHNKEQELEDKKQRVEWLYKHLRVKEAIQEYQQLTLKIGSFKDVETFPHKGLERHRQLKEWMLPLESDIHRLEKRIESREEHINTLHDQLLQESVFQELTNIDELWNEYQYVKKQIADKETALKEVEQSIHHQLSQLGYQPGEISFADYHLSAFSEDKWRSLAKDYEQLQTEEERQKIKEKRLLDEQQSLEKKVAEYQNLLLPREEYEKMKEQVNQHQEAKWKQQWVKEQQVTQQEESRTLEHTIQRFQRTGTSSVLVSILILIISGIHAFLTESIAGYIWGTVFLLIGILIKVGTGKTARDLKKRLNQNDESTESLSHPVFSEDQLQQLKLRIDEHEHDLAEWKDWRAKLRDHNKELEQCRQDQDLLRQKDDRIRKQIHEERESYPFLQNIEIAYWPSLYYKVIKLQDEERQRENVKESLADIKGQQHKLEKHANEIAGQCSHKMTKTDQIWKELAQLKENEYKKRDLLKRLKEEREQDQTELKELKNQLAPYIKEQKDLFAKAGETDEESFMAKGTLVEEKQQLRIKQEEWLNHIKMVFDSEAEKVVQQSFDWDNIQRELEEKQRSIKLLTESIERNIQDIADLNAQRQQLEKNEQLSSLRHQFAFQKNKLREQVKQWMVYKAAESFLKKTKQIYQNEYLPEVIEKASSYFRRLTEGRYLQMIPPTDDDTFKAESADHILYDVSELSTGTAAQAYVSLRLALSEVMNDHHGVPFLVDDAFVHYDDFRKKEMLAIIHEISQRQQMIYFTFNRNDDRDQGNIVVNLQNPEISLL